MEDEPAVSGGERVRRNKYSSKRRRYPCNCRRPGDCSHTCGFCYEDAIVTLEDGKPYCKKHAEYLTWRSVAERMGHIFQDDSHPDD